MQASREAFEDEVVQRPGRTVAIQPHRDRPESLGLSRRRPDVVIGGSAAGCIDANPQSPFGIFQPDGALGQRRSGSQHGQCRAPLIDQRVEVLDDS
ncbi:hypothetical protein H7H51_09620 [Mycolicibacterium farcinogenes]|nr:hypothetical protein [Mycolicibacterium farcinogenes]